MNIGELDIKNSTNK